MSCVCKHRSTVQGALSGSRDMIRQVHRRLRFSWWPRFGIGPVNWRRKAGFGIADEILGNPRLHHADTGIEGAFFFTVPRSPDNRLHRHANGIPFSERDH